MEFGTISYQACQRNLPTELVKKLMLYEVLSLLCYHTYEQIATVLNTYK